MILPNYILIGAMKCGTTSLRRVLAQHPEVFMTFPDEPRFFFLDEHFDKGTKWYARWFEGAANAKAIGEGSGFYSYYSKFPYTAERVHILLPDAKIIYMVRHPIKRIESHWSWEIASGKALGNINQAVINHDYFLEQSLYWKQINAYRKFFDERQIKVLFFEDMLSDPDEFYDVIWRFLGVDRNYRHAHVKVHENSTADKTTDTTLLRKIRYYAPFNTNKLGTLLPQSLKNMLTSKLKTDQKAVPKWNKKGLVYVKDRLMDDTREFLKYTQKADSFWKI